MNSKPVYTEISYHVLLTGVAPSSLGCSWGVVSVVSSVLGSSAGVSSVLASPVAGAASSVLGCSAAGFGSGSFKTISLYYFYVLKSKYTL